MTVDLAVDGVSVSVDTVAIVHAASLDAAPGTFTGVLGPNGSGKSTLLRSIYRSRQPTAGTVLVDGRDVWSVSAKVAAQLTAVVAQEGSSDFDFTVREMVEMGRNPHKRFLQRDSEEDEVLVERALSLAGVDRFVDRTFATLSGGEKQRVLVARCLAQQSPLLVLDEPTNHLDVCAQFELLDLISSLSVTTVAALHDLNLAARYCDRVVVLDAGRVVAAGAPAEVLTVELLADVFGVRCSCTLTDDGASVELRMLGSVRSVRSQVEF
jgi:iron complex transport system ATP-binding protein